MSARQKSDFSSKINGIPCGVVIKSFDRVKPDHRADSDWDYHGYDEMELEILDRRGYPAPWLERKMSESDLYRLQAEASKLVL